MTSCKSWRLAISSPNHPSATNSIQYSFYLWQYGSSGHYTATV